MSKKPVQIPAAIHRRVSIEAARTGVTISSIVSHAIERELASRRKQKRKADQPTQEGSTTGAGSPAVSGGV